MDRTLYRPTKALHVPATCRRYWLVSDHMNVLDTQRQVSHVAESAVSMVVQEVAYALRVVGCYS
jgi:hypothetical protein